MLSNEHELVHLQDNVGYGTSSRLRGGSSGTDANGRTDRPQTANSLPACYHDDRIVALSGWRWMVLVTLFINFTGVPHIHGKKISRVARTEVALAPRSTVSQFLFCPAKDVKVVTILTSYHNYHLIVA